MTAVNTANVRTKFALALGILDAITPQVDEMYLLSNALIPELGNAAPEDKELSAAVLALHRTVCEMNGLSVTKFHCRKMLRYGLPEASAAVGPALAPCRNSATTNEEPRTVLNERNASCALSV